jgi:hypothetical protein
VIAPPLFFHYSRCIVNPTANLILFPVGPQT